MYPTVDTEAVAAALAHRLPGLRPRLLVAVGRGLEPVAARLWRDAGASPTVVEGLDVGLPGAGATPPSRVEAGSLGGVPVLVHLGGVRLRDGIDIGAVTATVDVAAELGACALVTLSDLAALADRLEAAALAVVTDHLNLTGHSPLVGVARPGGLEAPVYDAALGDAARAVARRMGAPLPDAVVAGVVGPELPTPAEQRMLRLLGADAVADGVVMEALVARARGLRTVALGLVHPLGAPAEVREPAAHGRLPRGGSPDSSPVDVLAAIVGRIAQTLQ